MAELGETAEPIMTSLKQGFAEVLKAVQELLKDADFAAIKTGIEEAFSTFINDIMPSIINSLKWIIDNKDGIMVAIVSIGGAFAAWKVSKIVSGAVIKIKEFKKALNAANGGFKALNATMKANVIGIVIAAITALVAGFIYLWNNCESFRNFWLNLWDNIKKAAEVVANWFKKAWSATINWFKNAWASIDLSRVWSKIKQGAADAWNGIKNIFSKVGSFFGDVFSKAWQKVKNVFSTGSKIFVGIKDGIVSAFKKVVNAIIRGINKVVAVPFKGLNNILDRLQGISIAGLDPFSWLSWRANVPKIPELERGAVLKKGQVGLLEGKGAEAVVPLERNLGWIKKIAEQLASMLSFDVSSIKSNAAALAYGGGNGRARGGNTVVNAGMTVYYNGNLSRKQIKQLENDNYTAIRMKLKAEGI